MATVAELQDIARELDLTFTTKTRKAELEKLIADERARLAEENNHAFVEANSTPMPPHVARRQGLMPAPAPRNVPMTAEQREAAFRSLANGGDSLTAKQAKRLRKKTNKNG